jgi:hypothetical protein
VIVGRSERNRVLVVVRSEVEDTIRIISARLATREERRKLKRAPFKHEPEEMLPEYDFSSGVRGKYAGRFTKDTVMVVLDPDAAEVFLDPKSVNSALRALGTIVRDRSQTTSRQRPRAEGESKWRLPPEDSRGAAP